MNGQTVAFSTTGTQVEAKKIAHALTERRLAACVNIIPNIVSVYRWKGQVEEAAEFLLIIKTRTELLPQLEECLRELHSYEVPELIALPVSGGLPAYLAWIDEETAPGAATLP